jgi:putative transcriptional regulator
MDLRVETGSCLAAAPDMRDENFMHTVVLMCAHTDEGAHGLVINRPAMIQIRALLPDHPVLKTQSFPVHQGGPVGLDTLHILHRVPELVPGGQELGEGVYFGGDLEAASFLVASDPLRALANLRFVLGYSGWGARQLEGELGIGAWLPTRLDPDWVFQDEPQVAWRKALRTLGRDAAGLEDLPPDVSWN